MKYKVVFNEDRYSRESKPTTIVLENVGSVSCTPDSFTEFWTNDVVIFHVESSALIYFQLIEDDKKPMKATQSC